MSASLLYIAVGTFLIGLGGWLATYGWDLKSSQDTRIALQRAAHDEVETRRIAMLRMLAAESIANRQSLAHKAFTEADESELAKFANLPRLQSGAATAAIASGLFASSNDVQLLTTIFEFQAAATEFNARLAPIENAMSATPGQTSSIRRLLRDGELLPSMRVKVKELTDALLANGIDPKEKFFDIAGSK